MIETSSLRKSAEFCFLLSLFLTLVFPLVFGLIKVTLLAYSAVALFVAEGASRRPAIWMHNSIFFFMCMLISINGFFVLRGMINGASAEGSNEVVFVYVLYPMFYFLIIFLAPSVVSVARVSKLLVVVSIVISFLTISQFLRVVGIGIAPGYSLLYLVYPGLAEDYMNFAFTGDSFMPRATERLVFLAPFSVGLLVASKSLGLSRTVVILNLIAVVVATAFTGRRAFMLILVLAVLALLAWWYLSKPRRSTIVSAIWVGFVVVALGGASLTNIDAGISPERMTTIGRTVAKDLGNLNFDIRSNQMDIIAGEAKKAPLLGAGFGNHIVGYVRNAEHPWRVELTYFALLFQTGVAGIVLYLMLALQLFWIVVAATRPAGISLLPYVFGLVGGLLAVSTNPYLNYGTGQWLLFLPIAIFNAVLVKSANDSFARPDHNGDVTDEPYGPTSKQPPTKLCCIGDEMTDA